VNVPVGAATAITTVICTASPGASVSGPAVTDIRTSRGSAGSWPMRGCG
jgi:hypothetical protein